MWACALAPRGRMTLLWKISRSMYMHVDGYSYYSLEAYLSTGYYFIFKLYQNTINIVIYDYLDHLYPYILNARNID